MRLWEARESKKGKEYTKESQKEKKKGEETEREVRHATYLFLLKSLKLGVKVNTHWSWPIQIF